MTANDRRPPAPRHLSADSKALWRSILADFELGSHHLALLRAALEARDRMIEAQAAIAKDGSYVPGRFGPRAHPALAIESQSRIAFARLLRELGLDLEQPSASRPPSRWRA